MPFKMLNEESSWENLNQAKDLLNQRYGLVMVINHFSKRDPVQIIDSIVFQDDNMRSLPIVAPTAFHQYKWYAKLLSQLTGIDVRAIITPDTVERYPEMKDREGEGFRRYIKDSGTALSQGGIVVIAPQVKRHSKWEIPTKTPIDFLIRRTDTIGANKIAFLPIALGIEGAENYQIETTGGFNLGSMYTVNIGPAIVKDELKEICERKGISADMWFYEDMKKILPLAYLK